MKAETVSNIEQHMQIAQLLEEHLEYLIIIGHEFQSQLGHLGEQAQQLSG